MNNRKNRSSDLTDHIFSDSEAFNAAWNINKIENSRRAIDEINPVILLRSVIILCGGYLLLGIFVLLFS